MPVWFHTYMKRIFLLLLVVLTACAPGASEALQKPLVLVFNGPAEARELPAAEAVSANINTRNTSFRFASESTLRFRETHTSFSDYLMVGNVAREGRNLSAPLSVVIGTPVLTREVTLSNTETRRKVVVHLGLVAEFISTEHVVSVGSISSSVYQASRWESTANDLPSIDSDPQVRDLLREAAHDFAPRVVSEIEYQLAQLGY